MADNLMYDLKIVAQNATCDVKISLLMTSQIALTECTTI